MPTIAALREHGAEIVDQVLAENAGRWETRVAARPGAHRGDRARRHAAAAARADDPPSARERGRPRAPAVLRELFGLDEGRRAPRRAGDARGAGGRQRPPAAAPGVRIGTRGSALALAQARGVAALLGGRRRARRDRDDRRPRRGRRDKERWVARARARAARRRGRPRRALRQGRAGAAARRASSSPRAAARRPARRAVRRRRARRAGAGRARGHDLAAPRRQLRALREDLEVVELRGNVDTRLRKLADGELRRDRARAAGLQRLGPRATRGGAARRARAGGRPGRAGARGARRRASARGRGDRRHAATRALAGRARARARARGRLPHAGRRARAGRRGDALALRAFVGRARRLRLGARRARRRASPRRSAPRWPRGCCAPARDEVLGAMSGRVYLVGAGPGDPGLLTARALELIARADVILHDRLIPPRRSRRARPTPRSIDVGKVGGGEQVPQDETTRLLVEHARAGRDVVRLKGGDPFVFGRGGEEALACARPGSVRGRARHHGRRRGARLRRHPGDAARHRERGRVRHRPRGSGEAETRDRLAGARGVPGHARLLHGRAPARRASPSSSSPPAARPTSRPRSSSAARSPASARARAAAQIADAAQDGGVRAPAITVVGPGRRAADELALARRRPAARLQRRRDARARAGQRRSRRACAASARASSRRRRSASSRCDVELPDLAGYDLLVRDSPTAPSALLARVRDARALAGPRDRRRSGRAPPRALREHGIEPDIVPARAVAEGLVGRSRRAGAPRADRPRRGGARRPARRAARSAARRSTSSRSTARSPSRWATSARAAALGADYATFTAASSARFFHAAAGHARRPAARLDRPGDERGAARARLRARRRGRRAHARRARRGAAGDASAGRG